MEVKNILGIIIIVIAVFGGITLKWQFDKDWTSLYRDGDLIAKSKWIVNAERTYINKNSWYRTNVICPRIIANGGYETATRCYYADDTYEPLSRSLIGTTIEGINQTNSYLVRKSTPNYKYGTRGAYAGFLIEDMTFKETEKMEEFPNKYTVNWNPKDTRNYKLIWRIENLKQINLPDGEYHNCKYTFGYVKIDLKDDCSKLEKAEIIDQSKIYFYFDNKRGEQSFDLILVDPTVYLSLEGYSRNITAELGSIINISANISDDTICIDVDHYGYGVNYSTGANTTTFNLNISDFRQDEFNDSSTSQTLTSSGQVGITMDNRSDILNTSIDLSSNGTISGLSIAYGNEGESFNGELQGTNLINTEFKYSDVLYNKTNVTYRESESHYIYFNVSNHPSSRNNLTFQLNGFEADEGNEINFYDYFNDTNETTNNFNSSVGLDYPLGTWNNFERNETISNWDKSESYSMGTLDKNEITNGKSDDYYFLRTCIERKDANEWRYIDSNDLDLKNQSLVKFELSFNLTSDPQYGISQGNSRIYLTDGTNSVQVYMKSFSTSYSSVIINELTNITIKRENHSTDSWDVYLNGTYSSTINVITLDDALPWKIRLYTYARTGWYSNSDGGLSTCATGSAISLYRLKTGGIYLNSTVSGEDYNTSSGNFTSDIFHTTASNIIAAILTATEYKPSGTNIYYYLSADNTNFEQVYSGTRHVFTNSGKNLTYKVMMNTTNATITPAVYKLNIQVISLEIENISIDLGSNDVDDWIYKGVLNSTTSPQNVTLNISGLSSDVGTDYIIKIKTDSAGMLEVTNFNQNSTMNPVELTSSEFEDCDDCKINFTFSGDTLIVDDLQFDYIGGNKTYTILAHDNTYSTNTSYEVTYYYSNWNYSFPSYVDYLEFIPSTPTTKNVIPYGQDSTRPILNITNLGYGGKNANFSMYLNESYSCVNLTISTSDNKTAGILLANSTWND